MIVSPAIAGRAIRFRTANRPGDVPMGDLFYVSIGDNLEVWMKALPVKILLGVIERVEQLPDGAIRLVGELWESDRPQLVLLPTLTDSGQQVGHDGGE